MRSNTSDCWQSSQIKNKIYLTTNNLHVDDAKSLPVCGIVRLYTRLNPPIGLSTKMHNKENITFLALLSLCFCNDMDSNMI